MYKQTRPKWYGEAGMGEPPAMKKGKMMYMEECQDDEMDEGMGGGMDCMDDMKKMVMTHEHPMPMDLLLAHSYVPWQCYDKAFSPREALMRGTLFPELWGVYPIPE